MTNVKIQCPFAKNAALMAVTGLCVLSLASCAGTARNVASSLPGGYLSDNSDACYANRTALDNSGDTFETDLIENVVVGAAGGAVIGTLEALISGGNVARGALIGAGAGAVTGFAATYLSKYYKESQGDGGAVVLRSISDVRRDNQEIDRLLATFGALRDCRKGQAEQVRSRLASGTISKPQAEAEMAEIRTAYREDITHARKIAENISKRSDEYAEIYNSIAYDNSAPGLVVEPPNPEPQLRSAEVNKKKGGQKSKTKPARVKIVEQAPPKKGSGTPVITVSEELVTEHREITTSNVAKRDQVYDQLASAEAENDEFALS